MFYQTAVDLFYCIVFVAIFSDDGKANADISKRSVGSPFRLDRSLQMLRLGKRGGAADMVRVGRQVPMPRIGRSSAPDDSAALTDEELFAALAAILDQQPRDDRRRQPPLPRYGRDSGDAARDLLSLLSPDDDVISLSSYFRPAPRGGRYKRSLPAEQQQKQATSAAAAPGPAQQSSVHGLSGMESYLMSRGGFGPRAYRAVPFARIGRARTAGGGVGVPAAAAAVEDVGKLQMPQTKKAVAMPRIGRAASADKAEEGSRNV